MTPETIDQDVVVTMKYALSLDDGSVVEFSDDAEPLMYLHGHENLIPGLERELQGLKIGDSKKVTVDADEGYGEYDPEDFDVVDRSEFPSDFEPEEGMLLEIHDEDGGDYVAMVTEFNDETVTLDFNHPMAGKRLHFEVTVLGLREATPEELDHGHVHEDDEHDHNGHHH
jgi:FKBP-type peptidyl-prolyl cis-trans isomerase SlyD